MHSSRTSFRCGAYIGLQAFHADGELGEVSEGDIVGMLPQPHMCI